MAGTETGMYVSLNDGASWSSLSNEFTTIVPIY